MDCVNCFLRLFLFPGKKATFFLDQGNWTEDDALEAFRASCSDCGPSSYDSFEDNYARRLWFKSSTQDSFLSEMRLFGHHNGNLSLEVKLTDSSRTNEALFANYLTSQGMKVKPYDLTFGLFSPSGNEDMKKLLFILKIHNEIPKEYCTLIDRLLEKGSWKY